MKLTLIKVFLFMFLEE